MTRRPRLIPWLVLLAALAACAPTPRRVSAPVPAAAAAAPSSAPAAPIARREAHRSLLHGVERVDDYFWLREKDTPAVLDYLKAENAYTDAMTRPQEPLRVALYAEMLGRIQETDRSVPNREKGFWYYSRTEQGQEHPIYCRKQGSLDAPEQVLLDLNKMRGEDPYIALGGTDVSSDGKRLAYSIDRTGFRVYTLRVRDLRTGTDLPDRLENVSSFSWAADGKTLFYVTEDEAKRPYRLWRHRLGIEPARDALIWEEKDERFSASVHRSRSDAYLFLELASNTTSEVHWLPAARPTAAWRTIAAREPDHEYYVDHRGGLFYIRSNDRGRNFRLVTAPVKDPAHSRWKEVIAQRDDAMLENVELFRDHYVVFTRRDALPHLEVRRYGRARGEEIAFDEQVYSVFPDQNADFDTQTYRFGFDSFLTPYSVYDYDVRTRERVLLKREPVLGGYDASRYAAERLVAVAKDGARIPISLVYRRDVPRDGRSPLLLEGYGAYGFPLPVVFDSARLSLLDRGVIYAVAHVRGGGDLGKRWHDQGRMMSKRNTFTDFIACAESLIQRRYTSPERLAIYGASAGGLLIGAVLNLRPDLFHAAIADVPFVDIVNTMLDESLPLTVGEFEEWGNPKQHEAFDYMMSYSPYDNVGRHAYPALLVESAYNDSQVMYFEPAKWVARLRASKTDANPLLLHMDLEPAGHGGKSGRYERLEERAFELAFLLTELGIAN